MTPLNVISVTVTVLLAAGLAAAYRHLRARLEDAEGVVGIYDVSDDEAGVFGDEGISFAAGMELADAVIARIGDQETGR